MKKVLPDAFCIMIFTALIRSQQNEELYLMFLNEMKAADDCVLPGPRRFFYKANLHYLIYIAQTNLHMKQHFLYITAIRSRATVWIIYN